MLQAPPRRGASTRRSTRPAGDLATLLHAGRLIDACGLKGEICGGAQISEKHGNVIINLGEAMATDIVDLMVLAHQAVEQEFSVQLEPEIVLCGSLRERWARGEISGG